MASLQTELPPSLSPVASQATLQGLLHEASSSRERIEARCRRRRCRTDLFYLLTQLLGRPDVDRPWLRDRRLEVQANPQRVPRSRGCSPNRGTARAGGVSHDEQVRSIRGAPGAATLRDAGSGHDNLNDDFDPADFPRCPRISQTTLNDEHRVLTC